MGLIFHGFSMQVQQYKDFELTLRVKNGLKWAPYFVRGSQSPLSNALTPLLNMLPPL